MKISEKRKEYRYINILFKTIYRKKSVKWRGEYLRKKHIFHYMGEMCIYGEKYRQILI